MKITKQGLNNFFFLLGIVMIVIMIFTFDISFEELWHDILHAGWWMFPILGMWFGLYYVNALAWREIIRANTNPEEHISMWRIYRLTITGYALNNTTPVGGLGGEPYRIIELTKDMSKDHATSSVILYSMMHIYSHFWFWFTSAFLYLALVLFGDDLPMNWGVGLGIAGLIAFCFLGFYFFSVGYRKGLAQRVIRWIGKLPRMKKWSLRFLEKHGETLQKVDEQIAALRSNNRKAFYRSLFLEHFARMLLGVEVMFMLILFGEVPDGGSFQGYVLLYLHCVLIEAVTSWCANIIGFLPLQLGVQEGGYAASTILLGLKPHIGIFISIIARVRQVVWGILGISLMKVRYTGRLERMEKEQQLQTESAKVAE